MSEEIAPEGEGQATQVAPEATGQAEVKTEQPSQETSQWYEAADDSLKGYIQNKGWDDPIKAVTSYQELEKFRGASEDQLLVLPKDPEEEGAFDKIYDKLGRPEAPDKYAVELPEGIPVDKERVTGAQEIAHKIGLNQAQFDALAKFDAEYQAHAMSAYNDERAKAQEIEYQQLQEEWGANAAEREELARRGLKAMLPKDMDKEVVTAQIEEAIGTAATLKLFANVGDKLGREHTIHDGEGAKPFGYTKEQAKYDKETLMKEIQGDSQRLANYNQNKGADVEKLRKLNEILAS